MERWRGRVAVVTGASSGIGAAIAYQLQDAGLTVVALARRVDKIPEAMEAVRAGAEERGAAHPHKAPSPGDLHCLKCDVSQEEDILSAFQWIKDNVGRVDILVNNAGLGSNTGPSECDTAEWQQVLQVNVVGLSVCTREAINMMREAGVDDGHIVHIGSIAGHIYPTMNSHGWTAYYGSKHMVKVLAEGLRKELVAAGSKIRVTLISPGVVRTDFFNQLNLGDGDMWQAPHVFPEDVSDTVLYALAAPPHVQIHDIMIRPVGETF